MSTTASPDIVALIKDAVRTIKSSFTNSDDDWIPILVVKTPKGIGISPIPIYEDHKEVTATAISRFLASEGATEAALIASSWMLVSEDGTEPSEQDFPIRSNPARQEVLILTHVTQDSAEMELAQILRDGVNPPELTEWSGDHGPFLSGLFADALRLGIERGRTKD